MLRKISLSIFIFLIFVACRFDENVTIHSQTNINTSQSNADTAANKTDTETFAKTFFVIGRFDDSLGKIAYQDHLIEFKDDVSTGLGIYVDSRRKSFLKIATSSPRLRADFLDAGGERYFVVAVGSRLTGTCGDESFVVFEIDDNLNVKMSEPNDSDCQGELYPVKIENVNLGKSKGSHRQISIGRLKFNLQSFDWSK